MMKRILLAFVILFLSGCSHFFDSDNTPEPSPLVPFTAEITPHQLWSVKTGYGSENEHLNLSPTLSGEFIYTSSVNGVITATNKINGNRCWRVNTNMPVTSGPGVGDGLVVVGSRQGEVIALQQQNGSMLWKKTIIGEILARPAIANHVVVIKTIDGTVRGLSSYDGHVLWSFKQTEPSLILRGSSAPLVQDNSVFVGFANGNLIKSTVRTGQVEWQRTIATPEGAFSIQRMIDIDADPLLFGHRVFAATYQGKIASLEWYSGRTLWSHDISSYTGMTPDESNIYITDAQGVIWAFGANSGLVMWQQSDLEARILSAPASMGNYVIVGDAEGYLHWLNKHDGHIAGRQFVGNAIIAAPIVENNVVYVFTNNGSLVAYTLS